MKVTKVFLLYKKLRVKIEMNNDVFMRAKRRGHVFIRLATKHSRSLSKKTIFSVLTPEAIHTGTSGYVNRCLGGPTPGLASLERPQQVPQR